MVWEGLSAARGGSQNTARPASCDMLYSLSSKYIFTILSTMRSHRASSLVPTPWVERRGKADPWREVEGNERGEVAEGRGEDGERTG